MLATQYLIGCRIDGLRFLCIQQTQSMIDGGAGFFYLRQRSNDLKRLALSADVKILERALSLRPPELVGRNINQAKSIFFLANRCHRNTP